MDLHEAGLQPDLEGDKRARMVAECRLEMSVRMLRRLLGSELRRLAEPGQRRANGALGLSKTFPDPVGRGLAQAAVEFAEGLPFVAGGNAVDEKRPQAFGGQEQPCDLVGPPDAESSAAAAGSISVAAEDPLRSHGLPPRMLIVIAAEKSVSNQPADLFAVRTRRQLQLRQHLLEFRLSLANSHAPARIQSPATAAILERATLRAIGKIGGGVRCLRQAKRACGLRRVCGPPTGQIAAVIKTWSYDDNSVTINTKARSDRGL